MDRGPRSRLFSSRLEMGHDHMVDARIRARREVKRKSLIRKKGRLMLRLSSQHVGIRVVSEDAHGTLVRTSEVVTGNIQLIELT
jgi:ribosomal protein L18